MESPVHEAYVLNRQTGGAVELILDVSGYYR